MEADELGSTISISTSTVFLPHQSDTEQNRFVFAYTITIRNTGDKPAQLLTRHWLITDSDGKVQEVHGDGVVGEQPSIEPGNFHSYSSGAVLETPVGTMEGRYGMRSASGIEFSTNIPIFRLAVPGVLN